MANIAVIFHWPPAAMDPMSLSELMDWENRARERSGSED